MAVEEFGELVTETAEKVANWIRRDRKPLEGIGKRVPWYDAGTEAVKTDWHQPRTYKFKEKLAQGKMPFAPAVFGVAGAIGIYNAHPIKQLLPPLMEATTGDPNTASALLNANLQTAYQQMGAPKHTYYDDYGASYRSTLHDYRVKQIRDPGSPGNPPTGFGPSTAPGAIVFGLYNRRS